MAQFRGYLLRSVIVGLTLFSKMGVGWCDAAKPSPPPFRGLPPISSRMKPQLWKRLLEDKEVIVHASLAEIPESDAKKYSFYAGMLVGASVNQVRQAVTNYSLYTQMIPYVSLARYSEKDHILQIAGGIWNFILQSAVLFDEMMDQWVHYRVIGGHFTGLTGDIYFDSLGEKGTAVYFAGEQVGQSWPPRFVIERGAEIVFDFTAKRMRSYIESHKKIEKGAGNGRQQEFPQPRSHI